MNQYHHGLLFQSARLVADHNQKFADHNQKWSLLNQGTNTCSKSTTETPAEGVTYVIKTPE